MKNCPGFNGRASSLGLYDIFIPLSRRIIVIVSDGFGFTSERQIIWLPTRVSIPDTLSGETWCGKHISLNTRGTNTEMIIRWTRRLYLLWGYLNKIFSLMSTCSKMMPRCYCRLPFPEGLSTAVDLHRHGIWESIWRWYSQAATLPLFQVTSRIFYWKWFANTEDEVDIHKKESHRFMRWLLKNLPRQ